MQKNQSSPTIARIPSDPENPSLSPVGQLAVKRDSGEAAPPRSEALHANSSTPIVQTVVESDGAPDGNHDHATCRDVTTLRLPAPESIPAAGLAEREGLAGLALVCTEGATAAPSLDADRVAILEGSNNDRVMETGQVDPFGATPCLEVGMLITQSREEGEAEGMTAQEAVAYAKLKSFCSNIIKKLAPPLLKELQSSKLRPDATPFTPKRTTRAAKKNITASRAKESPVENVLLHALGLVPDDLSVDDGVVQELKALFDSPLKEQHVRIIAGLFGKTIPATEEMVASNAVVVCAN